MDEDFERWKRWTQELSWRKIVWWPHRDLCRLGIDTINLLCALGLPGAEKMDIVYCLGKINQWAEKVKLYTAQMMHRFENEPERFGNSLGYFKGLCLVTALQQQCGVRFNMAKRDLNVRLEVADTFIFGIIQGNGGTCASLPVLYCAVGYRLGYPMFLMHTKGEEAGHSYVQWDDGEVRFNIEGTGEGMWTPTDDHYRTGRYHMRSEIERRGRFLKPNNMRHCLARFLAERAQYCIEVQAYQHAVDAMAWAAALDPENEVYLATAKKIYKDWLQSWNQRKPPGFPEIFITVIETRRFAPTVPLEFEMDVYGVETMECLLKDKEHDKNLWEPLRRGQKPARVPVEVESHVKKDGGKNIRFLFAKKMNRNPGEISNV